MNRQIMVFVCIFYLSGAGSLMMMQTCRTPGEFHSRLSDRTCQQWLTSFIRGSSILSPLIQVCSSAFDDLPCRSSLKNFTGRLISLEMQDVCTCSPWNASTRCSQTLSGSLGSLTKCGVRAEKPQITCGIFTRRITVLDLALLPVIISASVTIEIMGGVRRRALQVICIRDVIQANPHRILIDCQSSCTKDSAVYNCFQPSLY